MQRLQTAGNGTVDAHKAPSRFGRTPCAAVRGTGHHALKALATELMVFKGFCADHRPAIPELA